MIPKFLGGRQTVESSCLFVWGTSVGVNASKESITHAGDQTSIAQ